MTTTTTTTMSLQCHDITRRPDLVSVFDRFNGYCRTKAAKQSELIQPKSMKLQGDWTLLQFFDGNYRMETPKLSHGCGTATTQSQRCQYNIEFVDVLILSIIDKTKAGRFLAVAPAL